MTFDCNAPFIAYSLLSTFPTITENERDAVQVILELLPCYDALSKELHVTHEAHVVSQILLDELRSMARRHSYVQDGTLEDIAEAHELLNVIVLPLVCHLSESEYNEIRCTIEDADRLLSNPLELLNELLTMWRLGNQVISEWHSYPIQGLENYHFGANLPNGARLEELLMPLPYPTKSHSSDSGYSTAEDEGLERKHERRRKRQTRSRTSEFGKPRAVPRSECSRELALKSKPKSKSKRFFLPRFTSSHTSSESAHDSGDNSDSSRSYHAHFRRYPNFVERGGETECLCETVRVCLLHPEGHLSEYEADVKLPRRKRLVNLVKTAVMRR